MPDADHSARCLPALVLLALRRAIRAGKWDAAEHLLRAIETLGEAPGQEYVVDQAYRLMIHASSTRLARHE